MSNNRMIRNDFLGIVYGLIQPKSGHVNHIGSVSWPLGLKGGLDGKLTLIQNMRFLTSVYADRVAPMDVKKFFKIFIQAANLSPNKRLKELKSRDQKIFYMIIALIFSFDVFLVPSGQFLLGGEKDKLIQYLRTVFEARLEGKTLITSSNNKKFLREF